MASAAACVERATSELLIGPDWAINLELCDIINADPGQAKDAMKTLKKRLGTKNPKIQLLALFVLETLSKNCGDNVYMQIVERDILHEMVKIVKRKPDLNVREKILVLIDTWQHAFGGPGGRYPQYHAAYQELRSVGVEFPPRAENTVPLFTPPPTHPIIHPEHSTFEDAALEASLQSDASALSLADIQNAQGIADILMEMLNALEPHNSESVKQEVIIDLVEQCRSYQKRVMLLVNNTGDEELLGRGLALNDNLQRVVQRHDDIAKGTPNSGVGPTVTPAATLVSVHAEDEESEDDFSQLAHRSSRENANGQRRKPSLAKNEQTSPSPLIPPPPSSKRPNSTDASRIDYLSGDAYRSEKTSDAPVNSQPTPTLSPSSPFSSGSDATPAALHGQPRYDEPIQMEKNNTQHLPKAPWQVNPTSFLPPPPSKYSQRQQFFEQQQVSSGHAGSSYDGLIGETQNLSLHHDSPAPARPAKPEDTLFKDLVDYAKAKSSPAKPGGKRTP
uniref:TOM1-like protein 2 n=1 Tax=Anthurium amnicola TaxID=1678845 RepID=A0A1D1XDV0_9ARAE